LKFGATKLTEHAILGSKVLDHVPLSMVDPAGEDQEQQLPGLQYEFHMIPDECVVMERQQHPESAVDCQPQSTKGFCKYGPSSS
jgi:hypothetical protein